MIKSQEGNLILKQVMISNDDGSRSIDVSTKIFEISIFESVSDIFPIGSIVFDDQFHIAEAFPLKGGEKVRITFSTFDDSDNEFDETFFLSKFIEKSDIQENEIERNSFFMIHEDFLPFLKKYAYQSHFFQKKISTMVQEIFSYYGKSISVSKDETGIYSYLALGENILETLDKIAHLSVNPHIIYYDRDSIKLNTYDNALRNEKVITVTNKSIVDGDRYRFNNAVKDIVLYDSFDYKDVYREGINGFTLFNFNLFNDDRNFIEKNLTGTTKFNFDTDNKNHKKYFYQSKYVSDAILMKPLEFSTVIPSLAYKLGKLISVEIMDNTYNRAFVSSVSGEWMIYGISHVIDRNYSYRQKIISVQK